MEMVIHALKTKGIMKVFLANISMLVVYNIHLSQKDLNEDLKTISVSLAICYTLFQFYQNRPKK